MMVNKKNIIDFQKKKDKLIEREKTKKAITDPDLYDKHLVESEVARLRNEFGLDKKEEKE